MFPVNGEDGSTFPANAEEGSSVPAKAKEHPSYVINGKRYWQVFPANAEEGSSFLMNGEDGFLETKLLSLYRKPSLGRDKHELVEWIARLPENSGRRNSTQGKFALELEDGWWVEKIGLAALAVLVLTLLATLLWNFLGVGSHYGDLKFLCRSRGCHDGFRGAGGRVETGAVLGALVLMLGWTGVGVWVFLSWLA